MSGKHPTLFGGSMIIAGTVIGAGMLANPTATSGVWYAGSLLVLVYTWFSMLVSGLMILEVNTHYPHGANLDTMAKDLLGRAWSTANGLSVAFVLYLLTYAYIFVGGNMSAQALGAVSGLEVPLAAGQLAFFALFAACVWWSARWVDRFSTVLVGGMVIAFFWAAGGLAVSVKLPVLLDSAAPPDTRYWIYLGTALPVCLASFGFHGNVSSLLKYFRGDAPKVAKALKTGTLIALAVYIVWQTVVQGNLPRSQFGPVIRAEDNAAALIDTLAQFVPQSSLKSIIAFFSYTAIASSFLGVTLGAFRLSGRPFGLRQQPRRPHQNRCRYLSAAACLLPAVSHRLCYRHRLCGAGRRRMGGHRARTDAGRRPKKIRYREKLASGRRHLAGVVGAAVRRRQHPRPAAQPRGKTAGVFGMTVRMRRIRTETCGRMRQRRRFFILARSLYICRRDAA